MSADAPAPVSILKMGFAEPELLAKYGDYVDRVRRKLPDPQQATTPRHRSDDPRRTS